MPVYRVYLTALQNNFLGVFDDALAGAIWTLVSNALSKLLQTLTGKDMAARQDDGWVSVGRLAPADRTNEDGVVEHTFGERGLESELILRSPLRVLGLVDTGPFN